MLLINIMSVVLVAVNTVSAVQESGELTGCDDCFTPPISFGGCTVKFNGFDYEGCAISSNGYIVLIKDISKQMPYINPYMYPPSPRNINTLLGSLRFPFVAPFWADNDLTLNIDKPAIQYFTIPPSTSFCGVIAQYSYLKQYGANTNKYNKLTLSLYEDNVGQTYAKFRYIDMQWVPNSFNYSIGYGDGIQGHGFQQNLGSNPLNFLENISFLKYRVDQSFDEQARMTTDHTPTWYAG